MDSDLFVGVVPFVAVAEEGSFRGAARRLGVTPAAVSQAIARLEQELSVVLFNRTTRRVSITAEGEAYLACCRVAVDELRRGRSQIEASSAEIRGELRVSASQVLRRYLTPRLARFAQRHPDLKLSLEFSDRFAKLVDDGIDVAFRIGHPEEANLRGRRLFETRWCTVASPEYLARRGRPETVSDLGQHACLLYQTTRGTPTPWMFADGPVTPAAHTTCDDGETLSQLAAAGLGLAHVFKFSCQDLLHDGRLVEVLSDVAAPGPPVWMVWLDSTAVPARVRAFADFFASAL